MASVRLCVCLGVRLCSLVCSFVSPSFSRESREFLWNRNQPMKCTMFAIQKTSKFLNITHYSLNAVVVCFLSLIIS